MNLTNSNAENMQWNTHTNIYIYITCHVYLPYIFTFAYIYYNPAMVDNEDIHLQDSLGRV